MSNSKIKANSKVGGGVKRESSAEGQKSPNKRRGSSEKRENSISKGGGVDRNGKYSGEGVKDSLIKSEEKVLIDDLKLVVDENTKEEFKDLAHNDKNGMGEARSMESKQLEDTEKCISIEESKLEEKMVGEVKDKVMSEIRIISKEFDNNPGSNKLVMRKSPGKLVTKAKITESKVFAIDELPKNLIRSFNDSPSPIKKSPDLNSRKVLRSSSTDTITSSIDRIFTEQTTLENKKSRESPLPTTDFSKRKLNTSIKLKDYSASLNSSPLRKYNSSEDLSSLTGLTTLIKDEIDPNRVKGETIYDQFFKIAQQPRPDISPERGTIKKAPTRTTEQIDQMLYDDAVRRASIHHEQIDYPEITTNIRSQQLLAKKFIKDFLLALEELEITAEKLEIKHVISLLGHLNLLKTTTEEVESENSLLMKFWKYMQSEGLVTKERFISSSLAVLGIFTSKMSVETFGAFQGILDLKEIGTCLKFEEELKLHKAFYSFYENHRILAKTIKAVASEGFTHRPQLSQESENLAKKRREEIGEIWTQKRMDYFIQEKQKLLQKSAKVKEEKAQEELSKCTFRPKILTQKSSKSPEKSKTTDSEHRTLTLYEKSKVIKEKQIKSSQEIELEKNLAECTFAPKIKRTKLKEEADGLYSRSVQKNLIRLQKAREEEARKKAILEGPAYARHFNPEVDDNRIRSPMKPSVPRSNAKSPEKMMPMITLSGSDSKS